ncbi:O-antigen ligase family protein [Bradyrhizobium sp. ISRA432]|uniref:O-antigen ligase family protein n=1 Tax=unclassified Bradyrhizobium TaxID=2631580 RepID=UPI0024794045|nr:MULTISPECIES: O-antigen ligase family protein [unclassified Bradyrhizobium]WGR81741.1 O-antigen ligase family protein [Bradyrhizobium sp. ISRA430]WGR84926.1 O-antigen ligase family protein [Bradyrhizobium sp. ISRA432]
MSKFAVKDLTLGREKTSELVYASTTVQGRFFVVTCSGLVFLNCLTFIYHFTGSSVFNVLSNSISLLLISWSAYHALVATERSGPYTILLMLACAFTGTSYLVNFGAFELPDALKLLSIYSFFLAGRSTPERLHRSEKRCIYALAALPLLFKVVGQTKVYTGIEYPDVFSYFPNTNTAALYFSALFFALSPWFGTRVLIAQFMNAAIMNRVGPALATIISIGLWSFFPLRPQVFVALLLLAIASFAAYAIGALDRLMTGLNAIALIWSLDPSTVARMSTKQLIDLTGTTDMSAFFRITHWTNIWQIYSSLGIGGILFGYGASQTGLLTVLPLPPHNDYLRVLAEYGLLNGVVFVIFVFSIAFSLKERSAKTMYTVLLIYFLSENLIDNFTSMTLFFSYAGRFTSPKWMMRSSTTA